MSGARNLFLSGSAACAACLLASCASDVPVPEDTRAQEWSPAIKSSYSSWQPPKEMPKGNPEYEKAIAKAHEARNAPVAPPAPAAKKSAPAPASAPAAAEVPVRTVRRRLFRPRGPPGPAPRTGPNVPIRRVRRRTAHCQRPSRSAPPYAGRAAASRPPGCGCRAIRTPPGPAWPGPP